jgi:hypothetical protein
MSTSYSCSFLGGSQYENLRGGGGQRTVICVLLRSRSRLGLRLRLRLCAVASVAWIRWEVFTGALIISISSISRSGFSFRGSFGSSFGSSLRFGLTLVMTIA